MFLPRSLIFSVSFFLLVASSLGTGQTAPKKSSDSPAGARKAVALAEGGHCGDALPALRKSIRQISDKDLKRKAGLAGMHCAMTLDRPEAALDFLQVMAREFPNDPDVLYAEVHAFSDLSTRASQELAMKAPSSAAAHELLAESYEGQGKWKEAEKEYRGILVQNPNAPGIHFRLGRVLLSQPNPSPDVAEEAKHEFQQELQIDPTNAGADYVLGELARQAQQWDEAVNRFSRAAKLDASFAEAFLGLGMSLLAEKKYAEALPPLETAVRLEPRNPDAHYNLAMAYTRAGRKEDGEKEFAIHKRLIANDGGAVQPSQPEKAN
jgi:tetratricopeptide (TPR) repeat protein